MEEEADLSDIETTEFDWLVVDSAMDVISGLAVALGPSFAELWKIFEKSVMRYAKWWGSSGACVGLWCVGRNHHRDGIRGHSIHLRA